MRPISLKITLRKIKEIKIESEDIERRESGTTEPGSWGGFTSPLWKSFSMNSTTSANVNTIDTH